MLRLEGWWKTRAVQFADVSPARSNVVFFAAGKTDAKGKAEKALKAVKKTTFKQQRKPRYSVVFHRPKTLKHSRDPKYPRKRLASCADQKELKPHVISGQLC